MDRKVALVTGGAIRIGESIVRHLASQGWEVIIHYNTSGNQARSLAQEVGGRAIKADLSKPLQVDLTLAKLPQIPNLIINNAAMFASDKTFLAFRPQVQKHLMVNLYAPMYITEKLSRYRQNISIINMLDAWAATCPANFLVYASGKNLLAKLTKAYAQLLPRNIRLNGIEVGAALFKLGQSEAVFKKLQKKIPTSIDDILEGIDYIISHKLKTGEIIKCYGNRSAKRANKVNC